MLTINSLVYWAPKELGCWLLIASIIPFIFSPSSSNQVFIFNSIDLRKSRIPSILVSILFWLFSIFSTILVRPSILLVEGMPLFSKTWATQSKFWVFRSSSSAYLSISFSASRNGTKNDISTSFGVASMGDTSSCLKKEQNTL